MDLRTRVLCMSSGIRVLDLALMDPNVGVKNLALASLELGTVTIVLVSLDRRDLEVDAGVQG